MSDADIEIVQTWGFWIFLRKLTSKGEFELYSDVDSQIEHYQKIKKMFKIVTIEEPRNRNVSAFLVIGLLFNSCTLIIQDSVSSYIKLTIQILAIIFMIVGIYQTAQKGNNKK